MPDRIKVFVSSIQNCKIEDLLAEREAVRKVVESNSLLEVWAFEIAPASPENPEASYTDAVASCDVLILIVGSKLTLPVQTEYHLAFANKKRILLFVKVLNQRTPEVMRFLEEAKLLHKYASFRNEEDLALKCREAIEEDIIRSYKGNPRLNSPQLVTAQKLKSSGARVSVTPIYPQNEPYNSFIVEDVSHDAVFLHKTSNNQTVIIPASRISIFPSSDGYVVELDGRLQWTDPESRWKYFPEKPSGTSPFGIAGIVGRNDPKKLELEEALRNRGNDCTSYWEFGIPQMLAEGWEIVYDRNGSYLASPEPFRGSIQHIILLKRPRTR